VSLGIRQDKVVRPAYDERIQAFSDLLKRPAYVAVGQATDFVGYPIDASWRYPDAHHAGSLSDNISPLLSEHQLEI
jgi:hypothetical protein